MYDHYASVRKLVHGCVLCDALCWMYTNLSKAHVLIYELWAIIRGFI